MPQQRGQRMHIKSDVAAEDGPSTALLKFMEAHVTGGLADGRANVGRRT